MSRRHARLLQEDGKWILEDLKSVNGVFVNHVRIDRHELALGDLVTFGGGYKIPVGTKRFQADAELVFECIESPRKRTRPAAGADAVAEDAGAGPSAGKRQRDGNRLIELANAPLEQHGAERTSVEPDADIGRLQSDLAHNLERVKTLEATLKERLQAQTETQAHSEKLIVLSETVTCCVCSELFVDAAALACSHSFCSACIERWLRKARSCPVCRAPVDVLPVLVRDLDKTVTGLLELLNERERESFRTRREAADKCKELEEKIVERLKRTIAKARKDGSTFMSIEERWSEKDRKVFLDGLARYASTGARSVYCETTGLTDDWITNSTVPLLATALRNIGVDRLTKDRKPMQRNQMAMLLRAFVRGHALKT